MTRLESTLAVNCFGEQKHPHRHRATQRSPTHTEAGKDKNNFSPITEENKISFEAFAPIPLIIPTFVSLVETLPQTFDHSFVASV